MLTLYGMIRSRTVRVHWMLEELGLEYRREPINPRQGEARTPEYLATNPNARVPALRDGDLVLCESLAINLYLADRYAARQGTGLWPETAEGRGRCYQWSVWAMTELEPRLYAVLLARGLMPEQPRDDAKAEQGIKAARAPLGVLDAALAARPYLLGAAFSVADLNVASVMHYAQRGSVPLEPYPHLLDWLARCQARPACRRVLEQFNAAG
jgi:glutathione S-transferase